VRESRSRRNIPIVMLTAGAKRSIAPSAEVRRRLHRQAFDPRELIAPCAA